MVCMGTVILLAGIWFGLIDYLINAAAKDKKILADISNKVEKGTAKLKRAELVQAELADVSGKLKKSEATMASGDMYAWMITTITSFLQNEKVNIPVVSREVVGEVGVLPNFPYKAAIFSFRGTGYFDDFGKFVADFENKFPYIRIQNLEILPTGTVSDPSEKLDFRFELVTPIKPTASAP
ncbi:MAG: hypothetical protein JWN25_2397 [Verrucomicrobiales bacterium]|nr:hypothetical protein [Verrucomicrobiales bacterium]MDB6128969.1 hypothetical protein [Verrucomicrobiales bacterium]